MQISMAHHERYTMNNDPLSLVTEHRHLGILINDKLSWHPHIDYLCQPATRVFTT